MLARLRARLPTVGTPGPLFHATILCCQTGGLAFGIRAYISEAEKDRARKAEASELAAQRRADAAAIHALDRASHYFNAIRFYRLVLELEAYRVKMEREASSKKSWLHQLVSGGNPTGLGRQCPHAAVRISALFSLCTVCVSCRRQRCVYLCRLGRRVAGAAGPFRPRSDQNGGGARGAEECVVPEQAGVGVPSCPA